MSLAEDQYVSDEARWREYHEQMRESVEGPGQELQSDLSNRNLLTIALTVSNLRIFKPLMVLGGEIGEKTADVIAYYAAKNHPTIAEAARFTGGCIGWIVGDRASKGLFIAHLGAEEAVEAEKAIEQTLPDAIKEARETLAKNMATAQEQLTSELTAAKKAAGLAPEAGPTIPGEAPAAAPEVPSQRQISSQIYGDIAELLGSTSREESEAKIAHAHQLSKAGQTIYTQLINATLMQPRILGMKALVDVVNQPFQLLAKSVSAAINKRSPAAGALMAQAALMGYKEIWKDAIKYGIKSFIEDRPAYTEDVLKLMSKLGTFGAEQGKGDAIDLAVRSNPYISSRLRMVNTILGVGRRSLTAIDQVNKALIKRANLWQAAAYKALNEAESLDIGEGAKIAWSKARTMDLVNHPTQALVDKSNEKMFEETFTSHGKLLTQLNQLADTNLAVRVGTPYITVPANIFRQGLAASPFALWTERAAISGGLGELEQGAAITKMVVGTSAMYWVAEKVAEGQITGIGPTGKLREFWPGKDHPQSILINGTWHSYRYLGPMAEVISMAADATEIYYMSKDPNDQSRMFDAVASMMAEHVMNAPFLEWVGNMEHLMDAAKLQSPGKSFDEFVGRQTEAFIPGLLRDWAMLRDPRERETEISGSEAFGLDPIDKHTRDIINHFAGNIPGYHDNRSPKRDNWGNFVYPPVAMKDGDLATTPTRVLNDFNPVPNYGKSKIDPVEEELFRHGIAFDDKYDKIWGADPQHIVPIPEAQGDEWKLYTGSQRIEIASYLPNMNQHEAMQYLMSQDDYKYAPTASQTSMLRAVHNAYYNAGKQYIYDKYKYEGAVMKSAASIPQQVPAAPAPVIPGYVPGTSRVPSGGTLPPPTESSPAPSSTPEPVIGVR